MNPTSLFVLFRGVPDIPYQSGIDNVLDSLATVIALDERWNENKPPTLVIRSDPTPILAIMGYFDDAEQARIEGLTLQMHQMISRLRYVDYQQAERDCEILAGKLLNHYGRDELNDFCFVGIPRGGLIVLGMLSYCLNLKPEQLRYAPDKPVVVVDDCSISGTRFGQFLQSVNNKRIAFAPLYAHPTLLETVMRQEPSVEYCISAHDLKDYAPEQFGEHYDVWRERWKTRSSNKRYWYGVPDYVCFAWNEPDSSIWNPISNVEELGWRIIPDEYCLKNRVKQRKAVATIQHQPIAQGAVQLNDDVVFGILGDQIVGTNIALGENFSLTDVGADMWRELIDSSSIDTALRNLLKMYDVEEDILKPDLLDFINTMKLNGIFRDG